MVFVPLSYYILFHTLWKWQQLFQKCKRLTERIDLFIEDQAFSWWYDLTPPHPLPPLPSRQQVVSLSQSQCVAGRAYWREWLRGGGGSQITHSRESLSSINNSLLSAYRHYQTVLSALPKCTLWVLVHKRLDLFILTLKPEYILIINRRKYFTCFCLIIIFLYRISHSMLSSNQDTPVVLNSTGASSFPNYAVCSKLSTCSSCIEAEVIFYSAPAITSSSGSCIEAKIISISVTSAPSFLPAAAALRPR